MVYNSLFTKSLKHSNYWFIPLFEQIQYLHKCIYRFLLRACVVWDLANAEDLFQFVVTYALLSKFGVENVLEGLFSLCEGYVLWNTVIAGVCA